MRTDAPSNHPGRIDCIEPVASSRNITRRAALAALAGTTLLLAPTRTALAADSEDAAGFGPANSWRFDDGEPIEHPVTDGSESDLQLLASNTKYSTWASSYGTSCYGLYDSSSSSTTEVTVSGVKAVGVDVSKWQGDSISWPDVASDGISFAIIRCGYGSDLEDQDDSCFLANVAGAQAAGLDIGVYLYSYATGTGTGDGGAGSEAAHVLRLLDEAGLEPADLALPVFLDMEDDTQAALSTSKLGDIAETFCNAIEEAGYTPGIYANLSWWTNYLTDSVFDDYGWYRWMARYPTSTSTADCGVDDADMWQFSCNGTVSGISGDVDMNFLYSYGTTLPFNVKWSSHVQSIGTKSGTTRACPFSFGTTGMSKRLEAFSLELSGAELAGSITYRAHCQTYGWQDWVSDGTLAGTTGKSKRLEALRIKFTGDMAEAYDIYYRTHCQTYGWLDWAKNGAVAGTTGLSKRVESVQIYIAEKGSEAPGDETTPYVNAATPSISAHVQTYGWLTAVGSGSTAGTTGKSKRLEALKISFDSEVAGSITYRVHCQTYGWLDWVSDGAMAGTTGESKRLEAVQIKLSGEAANNYVVWYRVHAQTYGWLGWACNGATAGTTGLSKRLEAIQVQILAKNASAPGSTSKPYISK